MWVNVILYIPRGTPQAAEEAAEAKQAEAKTSKTDAKPEVLIDPRCRSCRDGRRNGRMSGSTNLTNM